MKQRPLTLFLLLFVLMNEEVYSQLWREIYRFNPQQTLQKIKFLNDSFGFTIGSLYNGSTENIHITKDGGKTWENASSGYTSMRFMDIFIQNRTTIFMSGNEGLIIRSNDAGKSWTTMNSNTKEQLWGIYFTSAKIGYAVGSNGTIITTNNGGLDWEVIPTGISNLLYDVHFTSTGIGFASGSNVLLRTHDGGSTWEKVTNFPYEAPADWIRCVKMVNDLVGYACADIGRIYKTIDGGENWERLNSGVEDPLFELDFIDENYGIVCGFNGVILRTMDGGANWTKMVSPLGQENLYSIDVVSNNLSFICTHTGKILQLGNSVNTKEVNSSNPNFQIYPNPCVADQITISSKYPLLSPLSLFDICNVTGKCNSVKVNWIEEGKANLLLSDHSPGYYYLRITKNGETFTQPFVKL